MDTALLVQRLLEWFVATARDLPWRHTQDPYAIWVSEVMLQQTQVKTVIPYWERWMLALPTVSALSQVNEAVLLKLWEGLGYYRRARNLQAAAKHIMSNHQGRFPADPVDILELPGVGRYTAGAISSIAFNRPEPILDGNIIRVLTRLRAIPGDPASPAVSRGLWAEARELVELAAASGVANACSKFNQALMELGAIVCLPRSPRCLECPLAKGCRARMLGQAEGLPHRKAAPRASARHFVVIVALCERQYCVRQRPADAVNGGLWEFPNMEVNTPDSDPGAVVRRLFGVNYVKSKPWCVVRHSITRYRMTQHVSRITFTGFSPRAQRAGEWKTLAELDALAFSSAHRRIVRKLLLEHEPAR